MADQGGRPRRWLRVLGALALAGVLAAGGLVVNVAFFRPFSLDLFYEKVFLVAVLEMPELLTTLGLLEQFGYRAHNALLDDLSEEKATADFRRWRGMLADLKAYDVASQSPAQRLSTRILTAFIEDVLAGERFRHHDYPVNQLFGVQNSTPEFLMEIHPIPDVRGAQDYVRRLRALPRKFSQVLEGLRLRESKGIVPPRFVLERVAAETRAFVAHPLPQHPLVVSCATRVDALEDASPPQKEALVADCQRAVDEAVLPAYRELTAFVEAQALRATTDEGVWKLPDGEAYYAYLLAQATTVRVQPEELHQQGLREVARLEAEVRALLVAQGELREGETVGQAVRRLGQDTRFLYPDTEEGRAQALKDYQAMLDDLLQRTRTILGRLPRARLELRRVPAFKEKTAPGAYYDMPAMDGTRPGIFYANLRDMTDVPRFGMRTLSAHEGVPGHHVQIALAQEVSGLPTFRKVLPFAAYSEGWALYAERLGKELGVYREDPFGELGRLQAELLRAVRLVVDTGLHQKRWTRQEAITYMLETTGMPEGDVVSEVERYIVMPGQACAYMVGMLRIQAMRQRAEAALGATWDTAALQSFHDVVLGGGPMPLQVLDEQVDAWISSRRHP